MTTLQKLQVAGLPIVALSRQDFALQMVADAAEQRASGRSRPPKVSFSVNGQVIAGVHRDPAALRSFLQADYLDADGMWLVFASRLFHRRPLPERIATTDFFHDCAGEAVRAGLSFYILGGTEENNVDGCARIARDYPGLRIAGRHHGYIEDSEVEQIALDILSSRADVVWVGMGFPRQERVALALRELLTGVVWIKTCGGLLEHILEKQPRAPRWMQVTGLEWLHRMLREPRRLGWRYLTTNPVALWFLLSRTR